LPPFGESPPLLEVGTESLEAQPTTSTSRVTSNHRFRVLVFMGSEPFASPSVDGAERAPRGAVGGTRRDDAV
jgi:hypothetical protein